MKWELLFVLLCVTVLSIFIVVEAGRTARVRILTDPCPVQIGEGEMV